MRKKKYFCYQRRTGKKNTFGPSPQENRFLAILRCGNPLLTCGSGLKRLSACLGNLVGMAHPTRTLHPPTHHLVFFGGEKGVKIRPKKHKKITFDPKAVRELKMGCANGFLAYFCICDTFPDFLAIFKNRLLGGQSWRISIF